MSRHFVLTLSIIVLVYSYELRAQCTSLRQQRDITFNTNRDCAPVDVTDYTITYFFNTPQDPSSIQIRFEWNDPANTVDVFGLGDPGFLADGTQTEFTATGTFTYPENEDCLFEPQAFVVVDGLICETSEQIQLVSSWARDNEFGGDLAVNPFYFDVCFANPVRNAVFQDASEFNCNINQEPDNPNRQSRYTQFVYGMNHNAGMSIKNLSLVDTLSNNYQLTDNVGNLTSTQTINGVTGAYFGPIEQIPFPADAPDMQSLVMNAPADSANQVGDVFRITLFNWNVCNPFNGNYTSPNYADAITTDAFIRIIAPPDPDFQTRKDDRFGIVKDTFCIGDLVYFENLTAGGFDYSWEIYNDPSGVDLVLKANQENPVFTFDMPGRKLIRLTADNNDVPGSCEVFVEKTIYISPAAIADFAIFEGDQSTRSRGSYCQLADTSQVFEVYFEDQTINIESETSWRWEFFDKNNQLEESIPNSPGVYTDTLIESFSRSYSEPGNYRVVYRALNRQTGCETVSEKTIRIFPAPVSAFETSTVCAGERTDFFDIQTFVDYLNVDGDSIIHYDFDFNYDGVFDVQYRTRHRDGFSFYLDGTPISPGTEPSSSIAGSYQVAMRATTRSGCTHTFTQNVIVNALPEADLALSNPGPLCPGETISIYNLSKFQSGNTYELLIENKVAGDIDTLAFQSDSISYTFFNDDTVSHFYELSVLARSSENCIFHSDPDSIEVFPDFPSGFSDINYDSDQLICSPYEGMLVPDEATQALDADQYVWTIRLDGVVQPGFPDTIYSLSSAFNEYTYQLLNENSKVIDYQISLDVFKKGACIESSSKNVKISPEPSANFTVTAEPSCNEVLLTVSADQKGLADYVWEVSPEPDERLNEQAIQYLKYSRPSQDGGDLLINISLSTSNLNNCASALEDTSVFVKALEEAINADFSFESDTINFPDSVVRINNHSTQKENWQYSWLVEGDTISGYDPGIISFTEPGIFSVGLIVNSDFCNKRVERSIVVLPAHPIVNFQADSLVGCAPHTVRFSDLSVFTDYNSYRWDFGDGNTSSLVNPRHTYQDAGIYTVRLTAANTAGSTATMVKEFLIEVLERPVADFLVSPELAFLPDQQTFFSNKSRNAQSFFWEFGDGGVSSEENPVYQYKEEGEFPVTLIVTNSLGCVDTTRQKAAVKVKEGGRVRTPNAFTPATNGPTDGGVVDGSTINDIFLPRTEGVQKFEMLIYSKWGQLLFKSTDKNHGWNGYFKGRLMPADVYVYKLYLTFSDGRELERVGDVTLVR